MKKLRATRGTSFCTYFTILSLLGWLVGPLPPARAAREGPAVAILVVEEGTSLEREAARHVLSGTALALAETGGFAPLEASRVREVNRDLKLAPPYLPADLAGLGQAVAAPWVVAGEVTHLGVDEKNTQARVEVALQLVDVDRGEVVSRSRVQARSPQRPGYQVAAREGVQEAADRAAVTAVQELLARRDGPVGFVLSAGAEELTISLGSRQGVGPDTEVAILREGRTLATARVVRALVTNATAVLLDASPGATIKLQDPVRVVYTPSPTLQETSPKKPPKEKLSRNWVWMALLVLGGIALANELKDDDGPARGTPGGTKGAPATPQGFTGIPGNGEARLFWEENTEPDLAGYRVYRSELPDRGFTLIAPLLATTTAYTDTDLRNGQAYYYRLSAVDTEQRESARTAVTSVTPQGIVDAPTTPTGLLVTAGDQQVTLAWQPNPEGNLTGYGVYRSSEEDRGFRRIALVSALDTSYVDTDVTNGTPYFYRLTALGSDQAESEPTAPVQAIPVAATAPAVPTGLSATPGDGQVLVQWNPNPEPDVAHYRIYRALARNGNFAPLDPPVAHPATAYTDTDVTNGVTYYYRLTAVNGAGLESNRTEWVSATPQATVAPTTPTGFTATPEDKQVVLTWQPNPEANLADYRLFRSESAGGDFTVVATITAPVTTFTDTNRVNGRPYFYRLTARNLDGLESAPTQPPLSVTPISATPPSFPTGLDVQAQFDRLILVWTANPEPDLKEYRIYRAVDDLNVPTSENGATPFAVLPRQTTTYIDRSVTADHLYFYRLTAVNLADLESSPSIPAQGRPGQPKVQLVAPADGQTFLPERKVDLEKNEETRSATIQFGWNPVANASRYLFELAEDEAITRLLANELVTASSTPAHEVTRVVGPLTPIGVIVGAEELYWRITAVNDNNVVIDQSQVRQLTIDWDG